MALSNVERQRKWVEKNRALHNLRRRNARKVLSGGVESRHAPEVASPYVPQTKRALRSEDSGSSAPPAQAPKSKIAELRELVEKVSQEPAVPCAAPSVFRDDYGRVISETQFKRLQERKELARSGGYVLDEYSQ